MCFMLIRECSIISHNPLIDEPDMVVPSDDGDDVNVYIMILS